MTRTLLELSRLCGGWCWIDRRAFEVLGGWVASESLPSARVQFHAHSMRLGAHSVAFERLLPEIAGGDPADFVGPPASSAEEFFEEASRVPATAGRLGVAYALMSSRKIVAYRRYLSGATPVSEMAAIRTVAAVLADETQDLSTGIAAWEAIRREGAAATEAVETIGRFEEILRRGDPFSL